MRERLVRPVLVLAVLLAVVGSLRLLVGVGDYTDDNDRLLRSLPTPTGAERTLVADSASEGEGGVLTLLAHLVGGKAADGWTTRWEYSVPAGTTPEAVLQHYETRLAADGWSVTERCCEGSVGVLGLTRAGESLTVDVLNVSKVGRFEVAVDVHADRTKRKEVGG